MSHCHTSASLYTTVLSALGSVDGCCLNLDGQERIAVACAVTNAVETTLRPTLAAQVGEFHAAMRLPTADTVTVPTDARVRLRLQLIAEEFFETLRAAVATSIDGTHDSLYWDNLQSAEGMVLESINALPVDVDLPTFVDGLADLDYVVEGTRLEFGIDGAAVAAEVHRANMTKAAEPKRADGKQLKPPGWTPPDVAGVLRAQGWKEPP